MKKYLLVLALLVIGIAQAEVTKPLPIQKFKFTSTITTHVAGSYWYYGSPPYTYEFAYFDIRWTPAITEPYMLIFRYEYTTSNGVSHWSDYYIRYMSSGSTWYEEFDYGEGPVGLARKPTGALQIYAFGPNIN
jgi:hypothetical protein